MDKGEGRGVRRCGYFFSFYNIIIKCQNVNKGSGGGADNIDRDFFLYS